MSLFVNEPLPPAESVEAIFQRTGLLSPGQIQQLMALKGYNNKPMFSTTDDGREMIYNTLALIHEFEWDIIYAFLVENQRRIQAIVIFNSPAMNDVRIRTEREIDTMVYRPKQEESIYTCGRCKGSKVSTRSLQTRSADEPITVFIKCLTCGKKWKEG